MRGTVRHLAVRAAAAAALLGCQVVSQVVPGQVKVIHDGELPLPFCEVVRMDLGRKVRPATGPF